MRWCQLAALLCAVGWGLAGPTAHAQLVISEDDFTSLMDTPIMQQPIQQGTRSLMPQQQPAQRQGGDVELAPLVSSAETRQLCDAAVAQVAAQQTMQAFGLLSPYWPLSADEIRRLADQTQSQLAQLTANFGPVVGYEWVRSREAGKSLVQHLYLVKMQHHGLRIGCTFYKPVQAWQVHTVFWDDQIDALFEQ